MTKIAAALTIGIVCMAGSAAFGQELSELSLPPGGNGVSQRAEVSQWIGPVKVTIAYHSPSVHRGVVDRTGHIWGELVPFGLFDDGHGPSTATPWRAGANENTTITVSHDVKIDGRDLKAGTYAVFLELAKSGPWSWIFSSHATGWGSYQYDPRNDALRVPVHDEPAPFTEFLTYGFDARRGDAAVAYLQWENRRVAFEVAVPNVNELYVAQMRAQLQGWPGFNYQNWQTAAQFCADHRINLEEALTWADKALNEPFRGATVGSVEFSTLRTKAAVLEAMGREREAEPLMEQALQLHGTPALLLHAYASSLLASGKTQRALDVFTLNQQRHPEEPFWTYLGLARGFAAAGDKPNAIKNWEIALRHVPDSQKSNVPAFEQALRALNSAR